MHDCPFGAVVQVWRPEQADSCDFVARFGTGLQKILIQTYYLLVQKDAPCGSNYFGLGVFTPNAEFCRCHQGFNPGTQKARFQICQQACLLLKPGGSF